MDVSVLVAERKIREAMERGEFDYLPNAGKKLDLDEDLNLSDEMRLVFRIMRNMEMEQRDPGLVKRVNLLRKRLRDRNFASDEEAERLRTELTGHVRHLAQRLRTR